MVRARDVADFIERIAPLSTAVDGDVNGFMFGDPYLEVAVIAVCWSPTLQVLTKAAALRTDLVVCHEIPFFYQAQTRWCVDGKTETKLPNLKRYELLTRHRMSVYRTHSNWDLVPDLGNCDAFAAALGLGEEVARGRLCRVHSVPPTRLADLAASVKRSLGLERARIVGDEERLVTRVGTACGGLGLLYNCPEELAGLGAEVAIMGEAVEQTLWHALELGLAVIETTHVGSESFGLRRLAAKLQEGFPGAQVRFLDSGLPWVWA